MSKTDVRTVKDFGKMIRELRLEKLMSVEALAIRSSVAASRLLNIERGKEDPDLTDIMNIAEGLGMGASVILVNSVDTPPRRSRRGT
ncbi:MAG: helix-turn-helix transcriptional regulator [Gammaproteobacteria bacterium]